MIPKIVHYCWFGDTPMDARLGSYVNTWKALLPDYKFMLWNEDNIDFEEACFLQEAYSRKKYAFVSDYVRLKVLYEYGGIYLDTDVELVKDITSFLSNDLLLGFDNLYENIIASCFIGASKNNSFIEHVLNIYKNRHFISESRIMDQTPNTILITEELQKYFNIELINNNTIMRINGNVVIYPLEYFHALDLVSGKVHKTENTVAIHRHSLTWVSPKTKIIKFIRQRIAVPFLGEKKYIQIVKRIKR